MGAPSELPARFPCWCKATYSWGGETKKDLGFIEGDLIEALNAGDGLWWMGRLRRDPRAIGVFPSNFVKVLDESFTPAPNSRNVSPMVQQSNIPTKRDSVFRKPFQAYQSAGPKGTTVEKLLETEKRLEAEKERSNGKRRPFSSMKTAQPPGASMRSSPTKPAEVVSHVPSPPPRRGSRRPTSRTASPLTHSRAGASASPTPTPTNGYGAPPSTYRAPAPQQQYRAPSPQPMYRAPCPQPDYRAPSPQPIYRAYSPQPQHRAPSPQPIYRAYSPQPQHRAPSPQPIYRAYSPQPQQYEAPSPAGSRAPSPLPSSFHDGSAFPQLLPQTSRAPSPNPYQESQYGSRAPSPQPQYDDYQPYSRGPSPAPFEDDLGSSPPPPPPVHRVPFQQSRAPSPLPHSYGNGNNHPDRGGSRTPVPPSPGNGSQMTPSPLRDAMNDVMSSLQDMSVLQSSPPATMQKKPSNIWSPDEFEHVRSQSRQHMRAQSSLGFATNDTQYGAQSRTPSDPPQLDSYVQQMEKQLHHKSSYSGQPPAPPLKGSQYQTSRPTTASSQSSYESNSRPQLHSQAKHPSLKQRKSAYELGREALNRTYTTKTNATNSTNSSSATQSSNSTQLTSRSIMSGYSAGGFSATSAGSLARRKFGLGSQKSTHRPIQLTSHKSTGDLLSSGRSQAGSDSSGSGPSYHESHASGNQPLRTPTADWTKDPMETAGVLGGLSAPKARKSGFFKKMIESAKTTAKTGAANARSTIGSAAGSRPGSRAGSPTKPLFGGNGPTGIAGGLAIRPATAGGDTAKEMGIGGGNEWMQVRRDVNRSNTVSRKEREERAERCEMLDVPAFSPVELLNEQVEGDEGLDGLPITDPTEFITPNLALVDKSTRFINSIPPLINPAALAQSYVCRPHRSDVQRLRAIFTWVAERITWEEDFEGQPDSRRVIQTKRGCSEEIAVLVRDMCNAIGLHSEVVRGYLKAPGEILDLETIARPNHWWNAVIVDGEWRIMDCSLASPTNPRRSAYSSASSQVAETWYFLARPLEICYTHIPLLPEQQHVVPPVAHEILIGLPCACPTYFRHHLELADFDTSIMYLENLEMAHLYINVPEDIECVAEVESRGLARDSDGDLFESGDMVRKRVLAQAEWVQGRKRFTVKALPPPDATDAVLKIYAGKRGLMHSVKDNPHPIALALPITHTGQNPAYDFVLRHPTPHAQRHDLYVAQPQCARLVINSTFVFCVRQHPSSLSRFTPDTWGSNSSTMRPSSPNTAAAPYARPTSAMSMVSATMSIAQSQTGSDSSSGQGMTAAQQKPAKLAIQSPSQKIIRLTRKQDRGGPGVEGEGGLASAWETVIKVGERGTWRGLVLADRSARWCVFAEWECV